MIFHTAAEINYYNAFFKRWHQSILRLCPDAKFSLKFVGDIAKTSVINYTTKHNINLILDPTTPDELTKKYGSMEIGKGYYPMARWNSIPVNDDVCVTDVDVVMIKNNLSVINSFLKTYDFVSISRTKINKINPMMINYIKQRRCEEIKDYAMSLMNSSNFRWDIDLEVMDYMKKKLSHTYIHELRKFDQGASLMPSSFQDVSFGYYSSVSVTIDGINYASGFDSKKAKYEWADTNDVFIRASRKSV